MKIFVTSMQIEIDGRTAFSWPQMTNLSLFFSFFHNLWKTPEDIFRYFDTLKATGTGRTVSQYAIGMTKHLEGP